MRAKLSRGLAAGATIVALATTGTACGNSGDSPQQSKPATSYKPSCIVEELTGDGEDISVNICELKDKAPFTVELVLTQDVLFNEGEDKLPSGSRVQVVCSNMSYDKIGILAEDLMRDKARNIGTYHTTRGNKLVGMASVRAFKDGEASKALDQIAAKYGTESCSDPRVALTTTQNDQRS